VQLQWEKSPADEWCVLDKIDLEAIEQAGVPHGVFVIWRNGARHMSAAGRCGKSSRTVAATRSFAASRA
jgi:hypothetical protein